MLMKNNLKSMRKVGVSVWIKGDDKTQKMANGKHSVTFTVYDATPDEVVRVIQKALDQEAKK